MDELHSQTYDAGTAASAGVKSRSQGNRSRINSPARLDQRSELYDLLMDHNGECYANNVYFAQMIASHCIGDGAMATTLGLERADFASLLQRHFRLDEVPVKHVKADSGERHDERDELISLMLAHRAGIDPSEVDVARIVASACMAADHLWQDLGLWSRNELSAMMTLNFPSLAAQNNRNMKWKKFLYKQLCNAEGIYVCRAPSCEVCTDYNHCFGDES